MKKSFLALYAAPVALLLMAGGLCTPSAFADPAPRLKPANTVKGVFSFDRNAAPEAIYASLQRRAERLCAVPAIHREHRLKHEEVCVSSVIASGVNRIGRADIAQIHTNARG